MVVGSVFVFSTWVMAGICARFGAPVGLLAWAVVWSALIPVLGMMQMRLLPGPHQWIVRLVHLLMGLVAMGLGGRLAAWSRRRFTHPVGGIQAPAHRGA